MTVSNILFALFNTISGTLLCCLPTKAISTVLDLLWSLEPRIYHRKRLPQKEITGLRLQQVKGNYGITNK